VRFYSQFDGVALTIRTFRRHAADRLIKGDWRSACSACRSRWMKAACPCPCSWALRRRNR
jgi:hypothetical protein